MPWRVQSVSEGPVCLSDIGINFRKGDIMDLDLLGREHAESSNDIKLALQKGWIREIEKTPAPSGKTDIDPELVEKLSSAAQRADAAANAMEEQKAVMDGQRSAIERLEASNEKLQEQLSAQGQRGDADVLSEVRKYLENDPLGIKVLKETLENIQLERGQIAEQKKSLHSSGDSETEIEAKERILKMRDEKLEKNAEKVGKTISESSEGIDDLLGDMDALGI